MYFRMLKNDIKDKPGLNIVTCIFMIAAVTFTVIGSTMIYALFGGEQKTYEKCNSSDVFLKVDNDVADSEGLVESLTSDIMEKPIIADCIYEEAVFLNFGSLEFIGDKVRNDAHYGSKVIITDMPEKYDIPIDFDNNYFDVQNGCAAVSQVLCNRFNLKVGDKVRITTQMGNTYEFVISVIYKNPASTQIDRIYLSDRDKEIFYSECPVKNGLYTCTVVPGINDYISTLRDSSTDLMLKYEIYHTYGYASRILFMNNDGLFAIIVTASMLVVAVVIMAMTMITIDFSLKSAIKR